MVSKNSQKIMKDVDCVRNSIDIELLLHTYKEKTEKDFIQKYAETKMATISANFAVFGYIIALEAVIVASMLSISLFFYAEDYKNFRNIYEFMLIVLFIFFTLNVILFIKELSKKDVLKDIIIAVQVDKFATQEAVDSTFTKLDDILYRIDAINQKSDHLEKLVNTEFENIKRDVVSLKKKEEP